ncbi:RHS repeat-associated core domain-containing protein [Microvirga sp. 3-52]|nr:RHS repeat-associated core domain-containing protein [Microvirga sp. 3-52]
MKDYGFDAGGLFEVEVDSNHKPIGGKVYLSDTDDAFYRAARVLIADFFAGRTRAVSSAKDGELKIAAQPMSESFFEAGFIAPLLNRFGNKYGGDLATQAKHIRLALGDRPEIIDFVVRHEGPEIASIIWPDKVARYSTHSAAPATPVSSPADVIVAGADRQGEGPVPLMSLPPPELPSPIPDQSPKENPKTGGDPVVLFSGQLYCQIADFDVAGRGLNFRLVRTYAHQARYRGPLGHGWDHNYNLWLREEQELLADGRLVNAVYRSNGQVREDRYEQIDVVDAGAAGPLSGLPEAAFEGPPGFFDMLVKENGRYHLRRPDGVVIHYNADLQAERIVDPNGNSVTLVYDFERRITLVTDPVGKRFLFYYDVFNRLRHVRDETGKRSVFYTFSDNDDLIGVDLWPDGEMPCETDYEYAGPEAVADLQHNLVRVLNPLGHAVVEMTYGEDAEGPNYNRVIWQRVADGTFYYEYGPPDDPSIVGIDPAVDPVNFPWHATTVRDPRGQVVEHWFNRQGNVVLRRCLSSNRADPPSQFRYNEDGLLLEERRTDGCMIVSRYGREVYAEAHAGDSSGATSQDRLGFGRLHSQMLLPSPSSGEHRRIATYFTYNAVGDRKGQDGPYYVDHLGARLPGQPDRETVYGYDSRRNLTSISFSDLEQYDGTFISAPAHTFRYDAHGCLIESTVADVSQRYIYFTDPLRSGFVAERIEDASGLARSTTYDVDLLGRILKITGPYGAIDRRTWNGFDLCVATERHDPGLAPVQTRFKWNPNRQLIETEEDIVEADGTSRLDGPLVTRHYYDGFGRLVGWSMGDRAVTQTPGVDGRVERRTDPRGIETRWIYDDSGRIISVVRGYGTPEAAQRWTEYRRGVDPAALVDAEGHRTEFLYDAFGRPAGERRPDGAELISALDAPGRVIRELLTRIDPVTAAPRREAETRYDRNAAGQVIRQHHHLFEAGAAGNDTILTRHFGYDALGRLVREEGPGIQVSKATFDGLGRITTLVDPDDQSTVWSYDDVLAELRLTRVFRGRDANGTLASSSVSETLKFGARGQLLGRLDAAGASTVYDYNSRGALAVVTNEQGTIVRQSYSIYGELIAVSQIAGAIVSEAILARDKNGNLTSLTDPNGWTVSWAYDPLNRPIAVQRGATIATAVYDREGRCRRSVDETGASVERTYTSVGQVETISSADIGLIRFQYDAFGGVQRAESSTSIIEIARDSLGRAIREIADGRLTKTSYTEGGALESLAYPGGRTLRFERSSAGRLVKITQTTPGIEYPGDPAASAVRDLARFNRMGDRITRRILEPCAVALGYDLAGRTSAARWTGGLGEEYRRFGGRSLDLEQHDGELRAYDHDGLGRLTAARDYTGIPVPPWGSLPLAPVGQPHRTISYTLDDAGNRLETTELLAGTAAQTRVYTVGHFDTYQQVGSTTVTHDLAGRMRSFGATTYHHDSLGRLTQAVEAGDGFWIRYDAIGRLKELEMSTGKISFDWFGAGLIGWQGPGAVSAQSVVADGQLLHLAVGGIDYTPLHGLDGSIIAWVDRMGGQVGTCRYGPFGEAAMSGVWPAPFGFRGYLHLMDYDLCLLPARAYKPGIGRFLQRDPAGYSDGTNLYAYALGAPTTATDRLGLESTEMDAGTVAWSAAKTAAVGIGVGLGVAAVATFAGIPLIIAGAAMLISGGVMTYANREEQAIKAGKGDDTGAIAFAALEDMAMVSGFHEAYTGRDALTDRSLTGKEKSERLGGSIGGIGAIVVGGKVNRMAGLSPAETTPRPRWAGLSPEALADADAMNPTHVWRGGAGDRGIGVIRMNTDGMSAAEIDSLMASIQIMDTQAGMGVITASGDAAALRPLGDAGAAAYHEFAGGPSGWHAGHLIDTRGGGNPLGPIMAQPPHVNLSIGGQWRRYQPGFRFDGFTLIERNSGRILYPSLALENDPGAFFQPPHR